MSEFVDINIHIHIHIHIETLYFFKKMMDRNRTILLKYSLRVQITRSTSNNG